MSAIVGLSRWCGGPDVADDLQRMIAAIRFRGPDGAGTLGVGWAGVAALALWATPEDEAEKLALVEAPDGLLIAADARLDNRAELLARLGLPCRAAEAPGDAALILAAYQRWGQEAPRYLLGDFAFAIWDPRCQSFFCARDPFGVKQLYYHHGAGLFACASEVRALLALPQLPRRLNELRLADLLLNLGDDCVGTLYEGIVRLPPATSMLVSGETAQLSSYWLLDPEREIRLGSDAEYAEAYRELLTRAVVARLRANGPVGATLSGGLDSSSITCLARDLSAANGTALHSFTTTFSAVNACDERLYSDTVPEAAGLIKHFVQPEALSALAGWPQRTWTLDEPLWNPTAPLSQAVYGAARENGIRVYLEGVGGDAVSGHGWEYLDQLARKGQWFRLTHEALLRGRHYGVSPARLVAGKASRALFPARHAAANPPLPVPFNPDFVRQHDLNERWWAALERRRRLSSSVRGAQWRDLTSSHLPSLALPFTDRAGALLGLDVRAPFLDRPLVEFCLALPAAQKQGQGWPRLIARRALAGVLPDAIRWRTNKAIFNSLISHYLTTVDRATVTDLMRDHVPLDAYLDMAELARRYNELLSEPHSNNSILLWGVSTLALWLRGGATARALSAGLAQ